MNETEINKKEKAREYIAKIKKLSKKKQKLDIKTCLKSKRS